MVHSHRIVVANQHLTPRGHGQTLARCSSDLLPQQPTLAPSVEVVVPPEVFALGVSLLGGHTGLHDVLGSTVRTSFASKHFGNISLFAPANDSETWCDSVSYDFEAAENASAIAIDLGANIGDSTIQMWRRGLRVIAAFEPMPLTYFYLRWNLAANGIPLLSEEAFIERANGRGDEAGVLALHAGATKDGRTLMMKTGTQTKSSAAIDELSNGNGLPCDGLVRCMMPSLVPPHASPLGPSSPPTASNRQPVQAVATRSVAAMLANASAAGIIHVLKVDCEGCEYEVLPDMYAYGMLGGVRRIVGEVHPWSSSPHTSSTRERYEWLLAHFCSAYYWRGIRHRFKPKLVNSQLECLHG